MATGGLDFCSDLVLCAGSLCSRGHRLNKPWRGTFLVMHLLEKQVVHVALPDLQACLALEGGCNGQ